MEQKYFISYAAYAKSGMDIFNDFICADEPISSELIGKLEVSLVERLNIERNKDKDIADSENVYYAAQIINFIKLG